MSGENWTRVAMSDDSLVADALLQLRHSEPPKKSDVSPIKLKWSVRQRRSRKGDQTRASPTTPLSLSDAMSLSGGCGGATTVESLEESSATVKPSETIRSKVSQTCALTTTTTLFKRPRKKKTLSELKDEEVMLLKESKSLKNELARMRDMVEQQRARNNALKKMKAESQPALSCTRAFRQGSSFLLPDLNMPLDTDTSPDVIC